LFLGVNMSATPEHAMRVLGLDDQATLEDVRCARRALALKHHPDRCADQERATRHMSRINAAADTLIKYLKNQTTAQPKKQRTDYSDISMRAQKAGHSARCRATDKPSPSAAPKPRPHAQTATNDPIPQAARPVDAPKSASPASAMNLGLIRMASASYRSALDKIGVIERAPAVDTCALGHAIRA
jgi:hypothetical protein